jgi:hypothetical protein
VDWTIQYVKTEGSGKAVVDISSDSEDEKCPTPLKVKKNPRIVNSTLIVY